MCPRHRSSRLNKGRSGRSGDKSGSQSAPGATKAPSAQEVGTVAHEPSAPPNASASPVRQRFQERPVRQDGRKVTNGGRAIE